MNEILDLVQVTLDELLSEDGIRVFWGKRSEIDNDARSTEYVIYTVSGDDADVSADGEVFYRSMTVSVQYYIKNTTARTAKGRRIANDRMDAVREALRGVGFGCPGGWMEVGDVDDVGFSTFRADFDIPRLMERV